MLSQPATSIFLKTKEPKAGKWVSEAIGQDRDRAHERDAFRRHPRRPKFHPRPADRAVGDGVGDFRTGRSARLHEVWATTSRIFRFHLSSSGTTRRRSIPRVVEGRQTHLRPKECHWRCAGSARRTSVDLDRDPEPDIDRALPVENETDRTDRGRTCRERRSRRSRRTPQTNDELDDDKQLAQPSFHFDRA